MRHSLKSALITGPLVLMLLISLALASLNPTLAARPASDPGSENGIQPDTSPTKSGEAVLKAQQALSELGLYFGPIDGRLNPETEAAVRIYQESAGLKINGEITNQLINSIYNATQIQELLSRLDATRRVGTDTARRKLLDHPATRDLILGNTSATEKADPTRDKTACFNTPTTRCLLEEAAESAKAVATDKLRDWVLGEILAAQARVGLSADARSTVKRIKDPRLIMVALHDIAKAQALSGRDEAALKAASVIPDAKKRLEALNAIAEIQMRSGHHQQAALTARELKASLGKLKKPTDKVFYKARISVILGATGETEAAKKELGEAKAMARLQPDEHTRNTSLRHVASALADMELPDDALAVISGIGTATERMPVLVNAANAQARAGDAAAALATAQSIEAVRYRAVVLGQIARSQAQLGKIEAARETLEIAMAAIEKIDLPYAKSFATSRVAETMISIAGLSTHTPDGPVYVFNQAIKMAELIDDNRLRARSLWLIAAKQEGKVSASEVSRTIELAQKATSQIVSNLSRIWMYSDIAIYHSMTGEGKAGWRAFRNGLEAAKSMENAWGRSRALAKLATGLYELAVRVPDEDGISN